MCLGPALRHIGSYLILKVLWPFRTRGLADMDYGAMTDVRDGFAQNLVG
jgi:hypothetical protein